MGNGELWQIEAKKGFIRVDICLLVQVIKCKFERSRQINLPFTLIKEEKCLYGFCDGIIMLFGKLGFARGAYS